MLYVKKLYGIPGECALSSLSIIVCLDIHVRMHVYPTIAANSSKMRIFPV
jgi:hypothetical protein